MRRIATLLISALCLSSAAAQDENLDEDLVEEQAIRRYTVEVIVFSYEEDVSVGSEVFLPDPAPVEEEPLIDADGNLIDENEPIVADFGEADEELEEELRPEWIIDPGEEVFADIEAQYPELKLVLLADEELVLGDAIRQFELLDAYKTIMHFGWTQPTYPQEDTPAIELSLFAAPPEGLDGTLTLYLSRYLHLVVDLALDAPQGFEEAIEVDDSFFSFGDSRAYYDDEFELAPQPVRYRIQENRIVKNGELRYFDHPKFGVLAKITRVEEEPEDELSEAAPADALVGSTGQ